MGQLRYTEAAGHDRRRQESSVGPGGAQQSLHLLAGQSRPLRRDLLQLGDLRLHRSPLRPDAMPSRRHCRLGSWRRRRPASRPRQPSLDQPRVEPQTRALSAADPDRAKLVRLRVDRRPRDAKPLGHLAGANQSRARSVARHQARHASALDRRTLTPQLPPRPRNLIIDLSPTAIHPAI